MKAAIIENDKVVNAIILPDEWPDVKNAWQPAAHQTVVLDEEPRIGDGWDDAKKVFKTYIKDENFQRVDVERKPKPKKLEK